MDSLLANYASSDEEQEEEEKPQPSNSKSTGFLSSLPLPKSSSSPSSSSLFSSPSPPKSHPPKPAVSSSSSPLNSHKSYEPQEEEEEEKGQQPVKNPESSRLSASLPKPSSSLFSSLRQPKSSSSISSSLFSSLPQPTKTHHPDAQILGPAQSATKRVVQFRPPPINPSTNFGNNQEYEDDEDDKEEEKQKKQRVVQTASVKSFLSSIPAPRNSATLGALPSASGTGRRSIIDADVSGLKDSNDVIAASGSEAVVSTSSIGNYEGGQLGNDQMSMSSGGGVSDSSGYEIGGGGDYTSWGGPGSEDYTNYVGYAGYENGGGSGVAGDYQNWDRGNGDSVNYGGDYGSYANYGQYQSEWGDASTVTVAPEMSGFAENASRASGKRGRNNAPQEIVEVKQDELMKNRPREDQVKLTGIAFGPAYQPTSTKGKPSKLHKRKHQIGSLFFDMKQKEMELAERRARGFLTKAQTQGKYGW